MSWDTPLASGKVQEVLLNLMRMLIESDKIQFSGCVRPVDAVGPCQLVCYFDGSGDAFAAVIYIRWKLSDGTVSVSLLCGKPRVTPSK